MSEFINAFHPAYIETYMPEFMSELRKESKQTKAGQTLSSYVEKKRETSPLHGTIQGISKKIIPAHMMRPKEMMVKRTQSQIMSAIAIKKRAENINWGTMLPNSKNIPQNRPESVKKGKK